jgi:hypothetical protein
MVASFPPLTSETTSKEEEEQMGDGRSEDDTPRAANSSAFQHEGI